jgi:hypothetical protein
MLQLDYVDTSGEVSDQTVDHARRLSEFSEKLARDLDAGGRFRVASIHCGDSPCTSQTPPEELRRAARAAGVRFVIYGGLHKMSTLVQWAQINMIDLEQDRVVFERRLTFRGDTDESWRRSEQFAAEQLANFTP